jgi:ribosomal protein S18 acetylase RimI-like enzyme
MSMTSVGSVDAGGSVGSAGSVMVGVLAPIPSAAVQIRPVRPEEYERLGAITVNAYRVLDGHVAEPAYETQLADIGARAEATATVVLAAVDDDGEVLGGATYVRDGTSPMAEHGLDGAASIRMLAVDPSAQGRGVGRALAEACIERARGDGAHEVVLHSTQWMATAHRLYERLGFRRDPSLDFTPVPNVELRAFRLAL